MTRKIKQLVSSQKVTSRNGRLNRRDGLWSSIYGGFVVVGLFFLQCWDVIKSVIESSAEVVIPYLKMIPAPEKPFWVCIGSGLLVGIITLIVRSGMGTQPTKAKRVRKRKNAGPDISLPKPTDSEAKEGGA